MNEIMTYSIKELRARKGWSVRELSDVSGISRVHLANIETHKAVPSVTIAILIAKALDVKVEDIKW